jgi:hypothetical protein
MAMKKIAMILATLLSATLLLGGCQTTPDDENIQTTYPKVVCTPAELLFTHEGATVEVAIDAEKDWGISSSVDWCKVSPSGGIAGTTKVKVTVPENKTNAARQTQLTIRSGKNNTYLPVRQNYNIVCVEVEDKAFEDSKERILDSVELSCRYLRQFVI